MQIIGFNGFGHFDGEKQIEIPTYTRDLDVLWLGWSDVLDVGKCIYKSFDRTISTIKPSCCFGTTSLTGFIADDFVYIDFVKTDILAKQVVFAGERVAAIYDELTVYDTLEDFRKQNGQSLGPADAVCAGHSFLILKNSRVYVYNTRLLEVEGLEGINIVKIASSGHVCAAISDTGGVYIWGWSIHYSVPLVAEMLLLDNDVVDIVVSTRYIAILTSKELLLKKDNVTSLGPANWIKGNDYTLLFG
jgi:hypothetical protein